MWWITQDPKPEALLGIELDQDTKLGLAHLGPFGSGSADPTWEPPQTLGIKAGMRELHRE